MDEEVYVEKAKESKKKRKELKEKMERWKEARMLFRFTVEVRKETVEGTKKECRKADRGTEVDCNLLNEASQPELVGYSCAWSIIRGPPDPGRQY